MELPENFFNMLTPLLVGATYFSAFKDGKTTCNRFITNYFLYLFTSLVIYFTAIKVYEEKGVPINKSLIGLSFILIFVLIFALTFTENIVYQHLIYLSILIAMAYTQKIYLEKKQFEKEVIEETLKKMMIIIVVCLLIAVKFPQHMNDSFLQFLFFGSLFVVFFRIVDYLFLKKKHNDMISSVTVFLFSGFIMYDSKRVIDLAKKCTLNGGSPNYLTHVFDMFLNIQGLFNNLVDVIE